MKDTDGRATRSQLESLGVSESQLESVRVSWSHSESVRVTQSQSPVPRVGRPQVPRVCATVSSPQSRQTSGTLCVCHSPQPPEQAEYPVCAPQPPE